MSNDWPLEALKAQAICARSYAYNNISQNKHSAHHFDVCSSTDCQVYRGGRLQRQQLSVHRPH